MTDLQIMIEFSKQIETLEGLKALANKYDNTELVLTETEWESIKLNHIDKRDWLRNGMTSDQWYNEMIESSKVILNKSKFKQLLDTMEFDNTATKNKLK
jgi:hypothetical protein